MKDRQVSWLGILVMAGMVGLLFMLSQSGKLQFGKPHSLSVALSALPPSFTRPQSGNIQPDEPVSIASTIEALAPTAAGQPSSIAPAPTGAQQAESYLGGTLATGRVAEVYIRVADNVFLAVNSAPEHLKASAERWVDVQFPELLANDTGSARAVLNRSDANVAVGDVVEIKFAHKDNPRYFPVKELTRVTELVASKDQMLARDYERRILARSSIGNAQPQWLSHASTAQATSRSGPTTTADARR